MNGLFFVNNSSEVAHSLILKNRIHKLGKSSFLYALFCKNLRALSNNIVLSEKRKNDKFLKCLNILETFLNSYVYFDIEIFS